MSRSSSTPKFQLQPWRHLACRVPRGQGACAGSLKECQGSGRPSICRNWTLQPAVANGQRRATWKGFERSRSTPVIDQGSRPSVSRRTFRFVAGRKGLLPWEWHAIDGSGTSFRSALFAGCRLGQSARRPSRRGSPCSSPPIQEGIGGPLRALALIRQWSGGCGSGVLR